MMTCRLRSFHDSKQWFITKKKTTLGQKNCDIRVHNTKLSVVDRKHAFITVDDEGKCSVSDNNSTHGTYVNDRRLPTATSILLNHGDVIRLGHAGPRFEVILETNSNNDADVNTITPIMSNLPNITPISSYPYGRYDVYTTPSKNTDKSNVVPHPPVRQRPVSANPANGSFHPHGKPTISGNWINCAAAGSGAADPESKRYGSCTELDKLTTAVNYETECHKRESVIDTLREEIDYLRRCVGSNPASAFSSGCHQKIAALHNQIQVKNEDMDRLRAENDALRAECESLSVENKGLRTDYDIRLENLNLRDENERLKDSTNGIGHRVSEMQTLMTQKDHKVALLDNELSRINKEKAQMAILLNTLQKEVTSKDETLKKTKDEMERCKVELRNRKNENATMATRLAKCTELKNALKDLKQKDEEITNYKYRIKTLDEKISSKDSHINDLHTRLSESTKKNTEDEENHKNKENDFKYQIKTLEEKIRSKDLIVKDLNVKLTDTKTMLSDNELKQIENSANEIESTQGISAILCDIGNQLIENGRFTNNLSKEIDKLQKFEAADNLRWVKECFLSYLCQECTWEMEIEDSLKLVVNDTSNTHTPPLILVQLIQEKFVQHSNEISSLQEQLNSIKEEHEENMREQKNRLKEKYKLKAEKALKEIKNEEKEKCENEVYRTKEEEGKRFEGIIEALKQESIKDVNQINILREEIATLRDERTQTQNDFLRLQMTINQSKAVENEYKEKLEEIEKQKKMNDLVIENMVKETTISRDELVAKLQSMENTCASLKESNDAKTIEIDELKQYKEKCNEQTVIITSSEKRISSLELRNDSLHGKIEKLNNLIAEYKENESKSKAEDEERGLLASKVEELINFNEELKKTCESIQKEYNEEKTKTKSLEEALEAMTANLSDVKADLSDKDKQKIEHLEDKCAKQVTEIHDQQLHLVKLSTLVDEQKKKLVEQDSYLKEQNEMLLDRHIPWAKKELQADMKPVDLKVAGERCLTQRHEEVINEQQNVIKDMHVSLSAVEKNPMRAITHPDHLVEMSNKIEDLQVELAVKDHQSALTDQELYDEVCRLKNFLITTAEELTTEKKAHKNNMDALEQCEELYLRHVRDTNKELDIPEILGAQPISFLPAEEREKILVERGKGLEVVVNRIKALKSRIERKDQLLEHYDDDLKSLRDTENYAGKKSYEVEHLQKELSERQNEISYLQEALKKWRSECDDLRRQNNSMKQKKVLMMDYEGSATPPLSKAKRQKPKQKSIPKFAYTQDNSQTLSC